MSIVTISRGSYSRGKEVAEEVGRRLGYEVISRDLILEASEQFNVPEIKLVRAIRDAPGILERFGSDKRKYVSYFRASLLKRLVNDNIVYHGLAGHFFLKGVSHVLKVRIIADLDERTRLEMERENISEKEALRLLKKDDDERRKWSKALYGIDTNDPLLYDLVLHIKSLGVAEAAEIICHAVKLKPFVTTPSSQQLLKDLALEAQVAVKLMNWHPGAQVKCREGNLEIRIVGSAGQEQELKRSVTELAAKFPAVKHVKVKVVDTER